MKLTNGLFEIGGEQVGIGVPTLTLEHTDMSAMSPEMEGMGLPNFLLPALMDTEETVELPFEEDGMYRIADTGALVSLCGYCFVQSGIMQGYEIKSLYFLSIMGGLTLGTATKAEDGKWSVMVDM